MNVIDDLSLAEGKVLAYQDLGLWKGPIAVDLPQAAGDRRLRWTGNPIPREIWNRLAGFFRHANETWHSEAQARLFYNSETGEWKAVVLPQRVGTGMFSGELKPAAMTPEQDGLREEAFAEVAGFDPAGTAHSHCDSSAFQSGTDRADELTQPGVHITFGKVSSAKMHVHGRISFRGVLYGLDWRDWFPDWVEAMGNPESPEFEFDPGIEISVPKAWLDRCFPPEPVKPTARGGDFATRYPGAYDTRTPYRRLGFGFSVMYGDEEPRDAKQLALYADELAEDVFDVTCSRILANRVGEMLRQALKDNPEDFDPEAARSDVEEIIESFEKAAEGLNDLATYWQIPATDLLAAAEGSLARVCEDARPEPPDDPLPLREAASAAYDDEEELWLSGL